MSRTRDKDEGEMLSMPETKGRVLLITSVVTVLVGEEPASSRRLWCWPRDAKQTRVEQGLPCECIVDVSPTTWVRNDAQDVGVTARGLQAVSNRSARW